MEDFQKQLRTTGSIERAPGSGRPHTTRTAENVDAVGDVVQSQENQPQTHCSTRQISRELGIPQTNNWRWPFMFSFAMNVNEQRIIAFLTEKCCYLNSQSKVRTQLRWCGKFYYSRMYNFFTIKIFHRTFPLSRPPSPTPLYNNTAYITSHGRLQNIFRWCKLVIPSVLWCYWLGNRRSTSLQGQTRSLKRWGMTLQRRFTQFYPPPTSLIQKWNEP